MRYRSKPGSTGHTPRIAGPRLSRMSRSIGHRHAGARGCLVGAWYEQVAEERPGHVRSHSNTIAASIELVTMMPATAAPIGKPEKLSSSRP